MNDYKVDFDGRYAFIPLFETSKHHVNLRENLSYQTAYNLVSGINAMLDIVDKENNTK